MFDVPSDLREWAPAYNPLFEFLKLMFPDCKCIVSCVLIGPKFVMSFEMAVRKLDFLWATLSPLALVVMEHDVLQMF